METPDTQNYVGKYYAVNRETETLLFDGTYLKDGMVVILASPSHRVTVLTGVTYSEAERYELNKVSRWCTISNVRNQESVRGVPQIAFIATYEDGFQIKRSQAVSHAWIVKNDSIPPEKYSSAWKEKIEKDVSYIFDVAIESQKASWESGNTLAAEEARGRAIGRIMKLIGEVISEVEFDRAHSTPETLPAYSKIDIDATLGFLRAKLMEKPKPITLEELARRSGTMIRPSESDAAVIDFDGKNEPGGHVWVDPLPAWKFDPHLIRQQLAYDGPGSNVWAEKNPAFSVVDPHPTRVDNPVYVPEVNSFSDNPPTISLASHFTRTFLDGQPNLEKRLIRNYLKMFPAPEGMHNCLEVGCKVKIFDMTDDAIESIRLPKGSPVYKIAHVLPLAEIVPSVPGPDAWKDLPESKYKCEKCGVSTHRDDAMNLRCNRCEWLCRECRCEPVEAS